MSHLADRLADLGWVTGLLVAGSLATRGLCPGVSDLDLVALAERPAGLPLQEVLADLHRELDRRLAKGLDLECVYVDVARRGRAASDLDSRLACAPHSLAGPLAERVLPAPANATPRKPARCTAKVPREERGTLAWNLCWVAEQDGGETLSI